MQRILSVAGYAGLSIASCAHGASGGSASTILLQGGVTLAAMGAGMVVLVVRAFLPPAFSGRSKALVGMLFVAGSFLIVSSVYQYSGGLKVLAYAVAGIAALALVVSEQSRDRNKARSEPSGRATPPR